MKKEEFVRALRDVADFFEAFDGPTPESYSDRLEFNVVVLRDEFGAIARKLGRSEKIATADHFALRKMVGEFARVDFFNERASVCTKRVVGKETVTEKIPTAFEERTVEREIVEWDCPKVLELVPEAEGDEAVPA